MPRPKKISKSVEMESFTNSLMLFTDFVLMFPETTRQFMKELPGVITKVTVNVDDVFKQLFEKEDANG